MILDVSTINPEQIVADVAALAATVYLLKQWLRADIAKMDKRIGHIERKAEEEQRLIDGEFEKFDRKFSGAIEKLADTVEAYIRTSASDRLRTTEVMAIRDREIEVKLATTTATLAALGGTVDKIDRSLERVMDQLEHLLQQP